jgi:DNA-binding NarL/FixJ family response regulator
MNDIVRGSFEPGILIVDDDEAHRLFARMAISQIVGPQAIFEASNLNGARSLIRSNRFLVTILDIRLHNESGFTLVKELRNELANEVPVIMISTSDLTEDVHESYRLGANCFISKGSSPEEFQRDLAAALRFFLSLR